MECMHLQVDGVPEFPSLLSLRLQGFVMDAYGLRHLLSKTYHLRSLTIRGLRLKTYERESNAIRKPLPLPSYSQLKHLYWTGSILLDLVRELTPPSYDYFCVTLKELKGVNNADIYAYICELSSRYHESRSKAPDAQKNLSSCLLEEGCLAEGGLRDVVLYIFDRGNWPALCVRTACTTEHIGMLFNHASSVRFLLAGAIRIHETAILASPSVHVVHLYMNCTCWKEAKGDILALNSIVALRAESGQRLKSIDVSFGKIEQTKDRTNVAVHMKKIFNKWKKKQWVKDSWFYISGLETSTSQLSPEMKTWTRRTVKGRLSRT